MPPVDIDDLGIISGASVAASLKLLKQKWRSSGSMAILRDRLECSVVRYAAHRLSPGISDPGSWSTVDTPHRQRHSVSIDYFNTIPSGPC